MKREEKKTKQTRYLPLPTDMLRVEYSLTQFLRKREFKLLFSVNGTDYCFLGQLLLKEVISESPRK
jgi:hypothetical protein